MEGATGKIKKPIEKGIAMETPNRANSLYAQVHKHTSLPAGSHGDKLTNGGAGAFGPVTTTFANGGGGGGGSAGGGINGSMVNGRHSGSSLHLAGSMLNLLDELDALLADMPIPKQAVLSDISASDFQAKPQKATVAVAPAVAPKPAATTPKKSAPAPHPTVGQVTESEQGEQEHSDNMTELDNLLDTLNDPSFLAGADPESEALPPPPAEPASPGGALTPRSLHSEAGAIGSRPDVKSLLSELSQSVAESPAGSEPSSPVTASAATRELDELMANLSSFQASGGAKPTAAPRNKTPVADDPTTAKYAEPRKNRPATPTSLATPESSPVPPLAQQQQQQPPSESSTQMNRLNDMMDTMTNDISRQGMDSTPKATCDACQMAIVGQVITALGKTFHPDHFSCVRCNCDLANVNFYERDGKAYCETDFHEVFAPECAHCRGPILGRCMNAVGKTFHPEHFFCAQCGKVLPAADGFHERDGRVYCTEDYHTKFAPKCAACDKAINDSFVNAIQQLWHPECFNCMDCGKPFKDGNYLENDGKPYCERHYHTSKGNTATCFACKKLVAGRVLTAMGRKYHAEHFCCCFCLQVLTMGTFKERQNRPYCMSCHAKLFG